MGDLNRNSREVPKARWSCDDAVERVSASWLLAGRADLKAVMDRLGQQIQTTQHYLGRLPDADDRALAAFESVRRRRP